MTARFEVHRVFEITGRGRIISGTILSGTYRIGMRLWAEHAGHVTFTLAAIDYIDNIRTKQFWMAFESRDALPVAELSQALPPGSILIDAAPVAGVADAPPDV